jgi:tetratricopeptide (TPR) repeat protein/uncharacterized caspase-like protein
MRYLTLLKLFLFAALLFLPAQLQTRTAAAAGAQKTNQWALLVGVNDYPGEIQDLRFARNDARSIKELLTTSAGFAEDHIRLLTDDGVGEARATKANIFAAIDQYLATRVQAGHQVLVFFAGHGIAQGVGQDARSYFLPADVEAQTKETLTRTAIDLEELARKLSNLKASQFTVFVDACREDPFPGRGLKGNTMTDVMARGLRIVRLSNTPQAASTPPPTSVVFYSCRVGERAYENPELQHGIFTYYILRGIRELAARPAGGVEAGLLAGYLSTNVKKWAAEYAQRSKLPIEQTPTMVATEVRGPVYVVTVSPFANNAPNAPTTGAVTLATSPENALLSINGQPAGSGPLQKELAPRQYTVRAELPGFQPTETRINVLPGYQQEVTLTLQPLAANANYERGVQFENQQLWPQAIASYEQALREDSNLVAAYERLANVYVKNNRYADAVALMTTVVQKFPANAALLARRSRALSALVESERQATVAITEPSTVAPQPAVEQEEESADEPKSKKGSKKKKKAEEEPQSQFGNSFVAPQKSSKKQKSEEASEEPKGKKSKKQKDEPSEAVPVSRSVTVPNTSGQDNVAAAIRDAEAAVQKDANLAAAHLALGFAYLLDPTRQAKAMEAFVRASTLTPDDAEAYYGVGYAFRLQQLYPQAIPQLKKAIELRPDYYEAQRELASCYFAHGQTDQAIRQYQVVASQRRKTKNSDELAANHLALASAYRKKGEEVGGAEGEEYKKAGKGYEDEARESDPTLKRAVKKLSETGVTRFIQNLLPSDARKESETKPSGGIKINVPGKVPVNVPVKVPEKVLDKVPGKVLDKVPEKVLDKVPSKVTDKIPVLTPSKEKLKDAVPLTGKDKVKEPKLPEKGKSKDPKSSISEKLKDSINLPVKEKTKETESKPSKDKAKEPVKAPITDKVKTPKLELKEKAKEPESKPVKESSKVTIKDTVKKVEAEKEAIKLPVKKLLLN